MIDRPYVICHILLKNVQKLDGDVVWLRYGR